MSERVSHEVHAAALGGRLQGARPCGRDPVSITYNRYVELVIDSRFPGARRRHGGGRQWTGCTQGRRQAALRLLACASEGGR